MKNFVSLCFSLFLLSLMAPGSYAMDGLPVWYWQVVDQDRYINLSRSELEQLNWQAIRKLRSQHRQANSETKYLTLSFLDGTDAIDPQFSSDSVIPGAFVAVVRDPNGVIQPLTWESDAPGKLEIPADTDLIGRYLVGIHMILGDRDVDGDGSLESIHLCAKHLIAHRKNGGKVGSASVVFIDDVQHMPLEIGPVVNTAKSRYSGGYQNSHRSYEMMVKYDKKPLPGAEVKVIALGSDWVKSFVTDERGRFTIMPPDDRLVPDEWQNYLYITTHHDQINSDFYISTFPVMVRKNRPEWRSKAMGFAYWAIIGGAISLVLVAGFVGRRYWQNSRKMIIFENQKIKNQ